MLGELTKTTQIALPPAVLVDASAPSPSPRPRVFLDASAPSPEGPKGPERPLLPFYENNRGIIRLTSAENCKILSKKYMSRRILGQGIYSQAHEICDMDNKEACKVKKISTIENQVQLDAYERDIYFLNYLKGYTLENQTITPYYYDSWACVVEEKKHQPYVMGYTIMEKFDNNMLELGKERCKKYGFHPVADAKKMETVMVWKLSEIIRMFCLAVALGKMSIIHGDLKPDQCLHSNGHIVVTDFGFSGQTTSKPFPSAKMGWTYDRFACKPAFSPLQYCDKVVCPSECNCPAGIIERREYATYVNVMQLEISMVNAFMVYVLPEDGVVVSNNNIPRFTGIGDFNRVSYDNTCHQYNNTYWNAFDQSITTSKLTITKKMIGL